MTMTRKTLRTLGILALFALGVAVGVTWSGRHAPAPARREPTPSASPADNRAMPSMPGMPGASDARKDSEAVEISMDAEAVRRAGIKTAAIGTGTVTASLTVPATVTSNAYRDTKVNALVGGIVRQVRVELGAAVTRGEPLAVIFSADLADAQMKYLSMQAMLAADHQKLERTQRLTQLGAASRQELEEITAVHAGHETEVAAAGQRLLLLGLSREQIERLRDASQIVSDVTVRAPGQGVVIARTANAGQVVTTGQELFTVTDLSTVWVIGDLYEKDFATVRVGSSAIVSVPAAPDRRLAGRVAYIDPRVDPATRTAKVRVEVANTRSNLRLGMFVNLAFETSDDRRAILVPRAAVQSVGDRTVVYVPAEGEEGKFTERAIKLGRSVGEFVEVADGLRPGERVVTEGSFFLRAEAARSRASG
ncbi:MAG TPA: efflux RND transporter periplasmic adaptor subunit [Methylomirabilota bacterium]|jgi:RND family efflux transporter MFP subunit|nr:efflux RND transporter periplasmic adaptor subunit [Methylomirabilota bacterium]